MLKQNYVRADGKQAAGNGAQFAPFAALRGLDALYTEKVDASLSENFHELTPEECEELSSTVAALEKGDFVEAEVFDGRHYTEVDGTITRLDLYERSIWINQQRVSLDKLKSLIAC